MAEENIVRVHGVRELRASLNKVDKALAKELKDELGEIAGYVVNIARPLVPRGVTGKAQASMKVRKQSAASAIVVGGSKAPYFPWLEWGGKTGRHKSISRPFIPIGRTIYPTLKSERHTIEGRVDALLERLARAADLSTSGRA